jgi:hypothetical protein
VDKIVAEARVLSIQYVMAGTNNPRSRTNLSSVDRGQILRQVTTPLGFYVLTLLILEATMSLVLTFSKLSEDHVWFGFLWMIIIFIGVVGVVSLFVWLSPESLLFEKEQYFPPALEPSALKDDIEDMIEKKIKTEVKPESLKNPA